MSQSELARRVALGQTTINSLIRGDSRTSRHLHRIARELGTTPAYLTGETDDPVEGALPIPTPATIAEQLGMQMIPEVDIEYSMGGGSVVEDFAPATMVPFRRDWLQRLTRGVPSDVFLTRGRGDSMMPTILDGDDVLVNRAENRIRQADEIWAVGYGELGMIKRVRRLPNGSYELNSDNQNVRPINATQEELFVVGRVIWIGRRM
jgi:phage repressor protein C with HTH and peptisase S24 domain